MIWLRKNGIFSKHFIIIVKSLDKKPNEGRGAAGKLGVQSSGPTMGKENSNTTEGLSSVVGRKSYSKTSPGVHVNNFVQKHFQCFYTNADSLLNKFDEFEARLHSSHCLALSYEHSYYSHWK